MRRMPLKKSIALLACLGTLWAAVTLAQDGEAPAVEGPRDNVFGKTAKYRAATLDEAKTTVTRWLDKAGAAEDVRKKVADVWKADMADKSGPQLLSRLGQTFSLVDAKAKQVVEVTAKSHDRKDLPSLAWLADDKLDPM